MVYIAVNSDYLVLNQTQRALDFDILLNINIGMDEKEFPSSSDESDADFVPKEEEDNSDTGSEVSNCETSEGENNSSKNLKRKKRNEKSCKKAKTRKSEEEKDDKIVKEQGEINVDALWADFKKDVNNEEIKKTVKGPYSSSKLETENSNKPSNNSAETKTSSTKSKGTFSIPNKNKLGGLSNVLNQIRKVEKMSTLQKSKLDWNNFKKNEGIEEEIKTHNRGKDGYLEKQDFLQRTDLRQFEIEKNLRTARRKF